MHSSVIPAIDVLYAKLESRFRPSQSETLGRLVVPTGNDVAPRHRWFRMKEAYSHRILEHFLDLTRIDADTRLNLVDPFMGSGTTGVSAAELVSSGRLVSAHFDGVETNPFLHLLGATKLSSCSGDFDGLERFMRDAIDSLDMVDDSPIPELSTFWKTEYIDPTDIQFLVNLEKLVRRTASDELRSAALLAVAAAVEPVSRLRRDGRALRVHPNKMPARPADVVVATCRQIEADASSIQGFSSNVRHDDSRTLGPGSFKDVDAVFFSPPYPNNIDYTEVYKMEAWLLGYYGSSTDFRQQRISSLRSHSSLKWAARDYDFNDLFREQLNELVTVVSSSIPEDRYTRARKEMIHGYLWDMASIITNSVGWTKPGGHVGIVVGNSVHGQHPAQLTIASDLLLAEICRLAGLRVESINIGRIPKRRAHESPYMRESMIVAVKPMV